MKEMERGHREAARGPSARIKRMTVRTGLRQVVCLLLPLTSLQVPFKKHEELPKQVQHDKAS
jgi:hypothetical protein